MPEVTEVGPQEIQGPPNSFTMMEIFAEPFVAGQGFAVTALLGEIERAGYVVSSVFTSDEITPLIELFSRCKTTGIFEWRWMSASRKLEPVPTANDLADALRPFLDLQERTRFVVKGYSKAGPLEAGVLRIRMGPRAIPLEQCSISWDSSKIPNHSIRLKTEAERLGKAYYLDLQTCLNRLSVKNQKRRVSK
jgi:hypothetical protein